MSESLKINIREFLQNAIKEQDLISINDIKLLLIEVLGVDDISYLTAHDDRILSTEELSKITKLIERRKFGVPLAYIVGYKWFYGRKFKVDEHCLIPRPESEQIIELMCEIEKTHGGVKVYDIGTGSGCLAITASFQMRQAAVYASDKYAEPLKIAKSNNDNLGGLVKEFKKGAYLDPWVAELNCNDYIVICANLPYVDRNWDFLSRDLAAEPDTALYVDKIPDELPEGVILNELTKQEPWPLMEYEILFAQIKYLIDDGRLRRGKVFVLAETDICQIEELEQLAKYYDMKLDKTVGYISKFII